MDWRKGDLALCVDTGTHVKKLPSGEQGVAMAGFWLRKGAIYTVVEVGLHPDVGETVLWLEGVDLCAGAFRFRKVTPDTEDAFDREVIEALKSEPVHVPQHDALHNSCQREVSGGRKWDRSLANREWRGW